MPSVNKVILLGNIGRVEVKVFNDGSRLALASLATTECYTRRDGTKAEDVTWHQLVVNGKTAEFVEKYITKGDLCYVEGKVRHRQYDAADGTRRTADEVVVLTIERLTFRDAQDKEAQAAPAPAAPHEPTEESGDLPF